MSEQRPPAESLAGLAAEVLEGLHTVVYGEPPASVRVWSEGDALVMLLRLAGPAPFGGHLPDQPELPGMLPYEALPPLIAAAMRARGEIELEIGSWSLDPQLGLVMLVFRLPPGGAEGSGEAERGARREPGGAAAWRRGGGQGADTPTGEPSREHLRLVEANPEGRR